MTPDTVHPFFGRIILASGSPRRLSLLRESGFDVEVVNNKTIDESHLNILNPFEVPLILSQRKAMAYKDVVKERKIPLLAADTVVILDGDILEKPKTQSDAIGMLKQLSGKIHYVVTGVTIIFSKGEMSSFYETTKVKFGNLTDNIINWYILNYKPFDKAGAYGIQEWIGLVGIEKIEGDFYNVMGLPVHRLIEKLTEIPEERFQKL